MSTPNEIIFTKINGVRGHPGFKGEKGKCGDSLVSGNFFCLNKNYYDKLELPAGGLLFVTTASYVPISFSGHELKELDIGVGEKNIIFAVSSVTPYAITFDDTLMTADKLINFSGSIQLRSSASVVNSFKVQFFSSNSASLAAVSEVLYENTFKYLPDNNNFMQISFSVLHKTIAANKYFGMRIIAETIDSVFCKAELKGDIISV